MTYNLLPTGGAIRRPEEQAWAEAVVNNRHHDFQNDFAARMDWCTRSYEEANQPPVPRLNHPDEITVKSGQGFTLDAYGSNDPDGDSLGCLWFHYPEAGTYSELIAAGGVENVVRANDTAPEVDKEVTAHFILKLTDKEALDLWSPTAAAENGGRTEGSWRNGR